MERNEERPEGDPQEERAPEDVSGSKEEQGPVQERSPEKATGTGGPPGAPESSETAAGAKPAAEPVTGEAPPEAGEPKVTAEAAARAVETAAAPGQGAVRHYVLTAVVSAIVLLFALAFFMAGFVAHALLDDDDGGGGGGGGGATGVGDAAAVSAAADDPAWGPEDATVVIEEFSDFQCPFCKRFATETLPQIREVYGDRVRYIYRDFPITGIHEFAQKAAEGGQCAHEQDLFWEFHDLVFANQGAMTVADLKGHAEQIGADTEQFDECLDSGKHAREVLLDMQDGREAGVSGTPAFLVNGLLVSGAQPFEQFQLVIDQALATGE